MSSPPIKIDDTLDACGLLCPEPVMLLHGKVRDLEAGQVLEVLATDPSTERDIARFCQFLGHQLLLAEQRGEQWYFLIQKKKD